MSDKLRKAIESEAIGLCEMTQGYGRCACKRTGDPCCGSPLISVKGIVGRVLAAIPGAQDVARAVEAVR